MYPCEKMEDILFWYALYFNSAPSCQHRTLHSFTEVPTKLRPVRYHILTKSYNVQKVNEINKRTNHQSWQTKFTMKTKVLIKM